MPDPLVVLGPDVFGMVLDRSDARSVARSLLVSRRWFCAACDDAIWCKKVKELWVDKAHIPRMAMMRGLSMLGAYSISFSDGKRTRITKDDLCDHAWEFHFKKIAPEYWRDLDPSWRGTGPPLRRYFHPDGTQTADPEDPVWGGHECKFSVVTSFLGDGRIKDHYVRINRWPRLSVSRRQDWSWELDNHLYSYSSIPDPDKVGGTGPLFPVW
ncbi:unnamed protein product [Victoria cruziana]